MAWPPDVADGQVLTAAHLNAIAASVRIWQGEVSANGAILSNVENIRFVNTSGTAGVTDMRLDGYADTFYMVAEGSSGKIGMITGGAERLRIEANGNILLAPTPGATGPTAVIGFTLAPLAQTPPNQTLYFGVNEGGNSLTIFVRYSNGTSKVALINLV